LAIQQQFFKKKCYYLFIIGTDILCGIFICSAGPVGSHIDEISASLLTTSEAIRFASPGREFFTPKFEIDKISAKFFICLLLKNAGPFCWIS
jgi:hypothetical protein